MKKLFKMALVAVAIFVTSCVKSDDGVSNKDLVGTWTAVSIFEGERSEELSECVKRTNIVFTETRFKMTPYEEDNNGKCDIATKEVSEGTYSVSGNTITIKDSNNSSESGSISLSGGKLTISSVHKDRNGNDVRSGTVFVKK